MLKSMTFVATLAFVASANANILGNGGFESGIGDDADSWNQLEIMGGAATAATDRSSANPRTGNFAMALSVTGAGDFGPVSEIQQQTAVGSVTPGETYDFSFWATGIAGPGTVAFYEVSWFDGDGSNGGGPQGGTGLVNYDLNDTYTEFGTAGMVAPATADSVFIQIRIVTGAFDGAEGSAFIDDVSFSLVPAPGALALLGLAGLAGRRRR